MFQSKPSAQAPKRTRAVAGTVVCHDAFKADTQPAVVTHRLYQGSTGAAAALVLVQAGEGQPGRIVDGHMDELPAGAIAALLTIPCHSVARPPESAKLLDIQM